MSPDILGAVAQNSSMCFGCMTMIPEQTVVVRFRWERAGQTVASVRCVPCAVGLGPDWRVKLAGRVA